MYREMHSRFVTCDTHSKVQRFSVFFEKIRRGRVEIGAKIKSKTHKKAILCFCAVFRALTPKFAKPANKTPRKGFKKIFEGIKITQTFMRGSTP